MITLKNIVLRRGPNVLLDRINWTIYHKQRIGLIGANGSGKSTLFAFLCQRFEADDGELELPKQLKLSYMAQETPGSSRTALDFVLDGDETLRHLEAELQVAMDRDRGEDIANIYEKLTIIDAYTAPSRASQLLTGLGFSHEEQSKTVDEFSGGWRVRLNLAKALMTRSDVLLLDEPTNHLDLDAVLWLEDWLKSYTGTLLLISHDRDFLDETVDHIAHLSQQQLKIYAGNYSAFEKQRAEHLLHQQAAYEKQQQKISHMQSFVDRFRAKASKAKQAQSRLKAIEKLDILYAVQTETAFEFEFKKPKHAPNPLLSIEKGSVAYGDHVILQNINLMLSPKARIGLLGPNGAGKSSLIKTLAGEKELQTVEIIRASGLNIGYFAQHQVDKLDLNASALLHMQRLAPQEADTALRKFLGSFAFSGDKVLSPVKTFSGGEKSRLALALIVWQQPNLLLLDEPTNHLDLEMRNALSLALQEFEGAMLLVSHDRFLVKTTTDQLLLIADQQVEFFDGDLNDYHDWLVDFRKKQILAAQKMTAPSPAKIRKQAAKAQANPKPLMQKIQKLEAKLAKGEEELLVLEQRLGEDYLYLPENKAELEKLLNAQGQLKAEISNLENDWLAACEERDS